MLLASPQKSSIRSVLFHTRATLLFFLRSHNDVGTYHGHVVHAPQLGLVGNELQQHRVLGRRAPSYLHDALPGLSFAITFRSGFF
jgi:hypothetical protein